MGGGRKKKRSWRDAQLGGQGADPSGVGKALPHADDDALQAPVGNERLLTTVESKSKNRPGKAFEGARPITAPEAAPTSEDDGQNEATLAAGISPAKRSRVAEDVPTGENDLSDSDEDEPRTGSEGNNAASVGDEDDSSEWSEEDEVLQNIDAISASSDDGENDSDSTYKESESSGTEVEDSEESD